MEVCPFWHVSAAMNVYHGDMKEENRYNECTGRKLGAAIFYEDAANRLIQENYGPAVDESGVDVVSRPTIDITQIEKGQPFIFTAEVAVKPEVKLGKYMGVTVTKIDTSVSDEEVDAAVEEERNHNARTVTVQDRAIQDGDTAVIHLRSS